MVQQIVVKNLQKPREINLIEDIYWLGDSFGFIEGRDTEKITPQILRIVLKDISKEGITTTERISEELDIASQRVNYHLRTLIDSGFLCREKKFISVRQGSVKAAVEEMRKDANRIFENLIIIAEEIDKNLGLKSR